MWRDITDHPSEIGLDALAEDRKFDLYLDTENLTKAENVQNIVNALQKRDWL